MKPSLQGNSCIRVFFPELSQNAPADNPHNKNILQSYQNGNDYSKKFPGQVISQGNNFNPKFADFGLHTDADGGQVQPVLGSFRPVVSPFGYDCSKRFISRPNHWQQAFQNEPVFRLPARR